jgi:hypothetical protein
MVRMSARALRLGRGNTSSRSNLQAGEQAGRQAGRRNRRADKQAATAAGAMGRSWSKQQAWL